jgi:hypothetical protein
MKLSKGTAIIGVFIIIFVPAVIWTLFQPSLPKENANQSVSSTEAMSSHFYYVEPVSLVEIKTALTLAGLQISDNHEVNPTDYKINNITPIAYTINHSNQVIMVYIFKSIDERKEVSWDRNLGDFPATQFPRKENYLAVSFNVRNALIIDMLDVSGMHSIQEAEQVLKPLQKAMLTLNGSQEAVFADRGTYWDARYVVDYYQHWYKDDKGVTRLDEYSNGKWAVKYIGPDPQSIHDIRYEYKTPGRGGSGDGIIVKTGEDYYLKIGNGRGHIPDKDSVITLTIRWNSIEESLNLKMISRNSSLPLFLSVMENTDR